MGFIIIPEIVPFWIVWAFSVLASCLFQNFEGSWWWLPLQAMNALIRAVSIFLLANLVFYIFVLFRHGNGGIPI